MPAIFAIIGDNLPRTQRAIGFGVQSILKQMPFYIGFAVGVVGCLTYAAWGPVNTSHRI